jgi:hypothetical protein
MWMDAYVQEIWIREHIAGAQKVAAEHHRLRRAKALTKPDGERSLLQGIARVFSIPRLTRRIVRMATQ